METLNNANSTTYLMKNYAGYNLWANTTLINWLKEQPSELMEMQVLSSFPSIKQTILHIWQTQVFWLSVIKGVPMEISEFEGDVNAAFDILIEQSTVFNNDINHLAQEQLEANTLVVSPWFECNFANFEYIMQVMNHSTYHRGQIITMSHQLGLKDAPMTDYNYYNIHGKDLSALQFTQQLLSSLTMGTMALPVV